MSRVTIVFKLSIASYKNRLHVIIPFRHEYSVHELDNDDCVPFNRLLSSYVFTDSDRCMDILFGDNEMYEPSLIPFAQCLVGPYLLLEFSNHLSGTI